MLRTAVNDPDPFQAAHLVTHHVIFDCVVKGFLPYVLRVLIGCADDVTASRRSSQQVELSCGVRLDAWRQQCVLQHCYANGLLYLRPPYRSTFREYFLTASSVVEVIKSELPPAEESTRYVCKSESQIRTRRCACSVVSKSKLLSPRTQRAASGPAVAELWIRTALFHNVNLLAIFHPAAGTATSQHGICAA